MQTSPFAGPVSSVSSARRAAPRRAAPAPAPQPVADKPSMQPLRALRAFRALAKDPDDLPQVFTIIQAMSGASPLRLLERFRDSMSGTRLLEERPDIVTMLADRDALRALPEGTLGRAYLAFVESENISAEGIRDAAERGEETSAPLPSDFDYLHARMRDTHDLWHAAVGYRGDVLGETALLAFVLAQSWNPGIAIIIALGLSKTEGNEARRVILDGYRRGRRAAFLPPQPWEELLALPISVVRERLRLGEPPVYTPVRTSELRAQGKLLGVDDDGKRSAATAPGTPGDLRTLPGDRGALAAFVVLARHLRWSVPGFRIGRGPSPPRDTRSRRVTGLEHRTG